MAGVKGKSGRKKDFRATLKYFNEQFDKHSEELIDQLIKQALSGSKEMLVYCLDRRLGKPHQSQDLRVTAERIYSPDELRLMSQPLIDETKLLNGWGESEAISGDSASEEAILDTKEGDFNE